MRRYRRQFAAYRAGLDLRQHLPYDMARLRHFIDTDPDPGQHVALGIHRHAELHPVVSRIRLVPPHIDISTGGPRRHADHRQIHSLLQGQDASVVHPVDCDIMRQDNLDDCLKLSFDPVQRVQYIGKFSRGQISPHSAQGNDPAQITVSGNPLVKLQQLLAQPRPLTDAHRQAEPGAGIADIADVIIQSLQFQKQSAQIAGAQGNLGCRRAFDRLGVSHRMRQRADAADAFGDKQSLGQRLSFADFLQSPVRIKQTGVQMQHRVADRTKPEMAGLDDSGMDRSHRDFRHILPLITHECFATFDPRHPFAGRKILA